MADTFFTVQNRSRCHGSLKICQLQRECARCKSRRRLSPTGLFAENIRKRKERKSAPIHWSFWHLLAATLLWRGDSHRMGRCGGLAAFVVAAYPAERRGVCRERPGPLWGGGVRIGLALNPYPV